MPDLHLVELLILRYALTRAQSRPPVKMSGESAVLNNKIHSVQHRVVGVISAIQKKSKINNDVNGKIRFNDSNPRL